MNKTTIKNCLRKTARGDQFITQNEVKKCMGWGNTRTQTTLRGLDCIRRKRTKLYAIDEVADVIYSDIKKSWVEQ